MKEFKKLSELVIAGYALSDKSKDEIVSKNCKNDNILLFEDTLIIGQGSKKYKVRPLTYSENIEVANILRKALEDNPKGVPDNYYYKQMIVKAELAYKPKPHEFLDLSYSPDDPLFWLFAYNMKW